MDTTVVGDYPSHIRKVLVNALPVTDPDDLDLEDVVLDLPEDAV